MTEIVCTGTDKLTTDASGNLLCATDVGGSGNSFETISVPAGTNPVADSSTDTLTITETSFLTITGTAATDTIDITQVTTDIGTDGLIAANAVALGTDTTNAYVATVADSGTGNLIVSGSGGETAAVTVNTAQNILTTSSPTFVDLTLSDAGPDLSLAVTGGDTFGFHAETQLAYLKNETDNITYWLFNTDHSIVTDRLLDLQRASLLLPYSDAPTIAREGAFAIDTNIWAPGRGAPLVFDGTSSVALVGTLTSDVPTNGQVPKWNTGGSITWENDTGGAGTPGGADTQVQFNDASSFGGDADFVFNKTTNAITLAGVLTSDGLTMGNGENLTIGSDTLTFEATRADFILSDDLIQEDTSPSTLWRDTSDNTAYLLHIDTADTVMGPVAFWRGTDTGSGFSVGPNTPLWRGDANNIFYIPSKLALGDVSLAKFSVDGNTDEIQLLVQGNPTQTTNLIVAENSVGTDQLTLTNVGNLTANGTITAGGTASGQSTINLGLVVNNSGVSASASEDFQVKGDTDDNALYVDASADSVGVGTASPGVKLDVSGAIRSNNVITSTRTTDFGWSLVSVTDQACNTTCTNACVFGFTLAAGVITTAVACTDATADQCVCAGAN